MDLGPAGDPKNQIQGESGNRKGIKSESWVGDAVERKFKNGMGKCQTNGVDMVTIRARRKWGKNLMLQCGLY